MISYLEGKVILKKKDFIILKTNGGIGYRVFLSRKSLEIIPENNENIKLFCYLDVGERSLKLYGFLDFKELEFFEILRNIPGVGPKASLEIVSLDKVEKVKEEIEKGNEKLFVGVSGIGAKKAKKIILELSGKLKKIESPRKSSSTHSLNKDDEVVSALLRLGFRSEEIKKAISRIPDNIKEPKEKIRIALKNLGK